MSFEKLIRNCQKTSSRVIHYHLTLSSLLRFGDYCCRKQSFPQWRKTYWLDVADDGCQITKDQSTILTVCFWCRCSGETCFQTDGRNIYEQGFCGMLKRYLDLCVLVEKLTMSRSTYVFLNKFSVLFAKVVIDAMDSKRQRGTERERERERERKRERDAAEDHVRS